MSALARFFLSQGWCVAGFDRTSTALTRELEGQGIDVTYMDAVESIAACFRDATVTDVVYTPAIFAGGVTDNKIYGWFESQGFRISKRAQVLGLLCKDKYVMAVAGTHGKTTTSTMVAYFNCVGAGCGSAFLGGVSKNFGSNLVMECSSGRLSKPGYASVITSTVDLGDRSLNTGSEDRIAVEADEFDRSFLQLFPALAVVTSVDADHLDIYGDHSHMIEGFEAFMRQVSGGLVTHQRIELSQALLDDLQRRGVRRYTYSLDDERSDFYAKNVQLELDGQGHSDGCYCFDLAVASGEVVCGFKLGIPGVINVENAVAALSLVWLAGGYDVERLREAVAGFRGVARRFDFYINTPSLVYMDDYAHHPTELAAMISSVRGMFAGRHLTVVFQPHLYSRTRDFAAEFSRALSGADRVVMLPIYPAREAPIPGVSSGIILDDISCEKILCEKSELTTLLGGMSGLDVVVTSGAGDIDKLCVEVEVVLRKRLV